MSKSPYMGLCFPVCNPQGTLASLQGYPSPISGPVCGLPHTHTTVYLMLKVFSLTWLSLFSAAMDHFPCYQGVQMSSQCISERPWKPLHESVGVHLWFGNILDHLFGVKDPKPKPLMFYLGSCKGWLHFLHTFVLLGQVALAKHKETFIIIQNRSSFPNDMLFGGLTHSQHFFPLKKKIQEQI